MLGERLLVDHATHVDILLFFLYQEPGVSFLLFSLFSFDLLGRLDLFSLNLLVCAGANKPDAFAVDLIVVPWANVRVDTATFISACAVTS